MADAPSYALLLLSGEAGGLEPKVSRRFRRLRLFKSSSPWCPKPRPKRTQSLSRLSREHTLMCGASRRKPRPESAVSPERPQTMRPSSGELVKLKLPAQIATFPTEQYL